MRKFGLIGGTSWRSTVEYYSRINNAINQFHGDNTNPRLHVASLDQRWIHEAQKEGDWGRISDCLLEAALELQSVGVEGIALCATTPHKVFDSLQAELRVSLLHIGDAIALECIRNDWDHVGLLGTRFTMEEGFLRDRLESRARMQIRTPAPASRISIQRCVVDKLSVGVFDAESRSLMLEEMGRFKRFGAKAVILGCTEFPLLLSGAVSPLPVIDSVACHCDQIASFILGRNEGIGKDHLT